ncbi:unnamed protein product [Schistosoma margrebowiei]|uniref:Homeobox domain-containing protein n=1 Tax=Schistosoma margrebowiei TaxID=48269 RepID=A0AA85A3B5_9TREM|nr:unnamed protein product [Schistosoma margrebowiei]
MQIANYLTNSSCNLSEIDSNLSTTSSSSSSSTTTTDKLNSSSSSSFLITDILASNNCVNEIVHLTNDNQSTDEMISVQRQNRQPYDNENVKQFQYDNDISMKLFTDYHDNNNNNDLHTNIDNIHIWQILFESLLTNSTLNLEQLESLLSLTRMSQSEFSNFYKEKIQTTQETFQYLPFELSKQHQQLNENMGLKSITKSNDIHSLKQLSQESWQSFQETSINNNDHNDHKEIDNHSITNYNEQQLNYQNKFKLLLTKSYEQYCRHTMNHLKQTENSILNTDHHNNNNSSTDDMDSKNKPKIREDKQEQNSCQEEDLKLLNLNHGHFKSFTKIDKIKTYQLWFNSLNCLNTQQKLYHLYKTNYFIKNYCQNVENLKINENDSLKSNNIVNNNTMTTNTTHNSNDSSNDSAINNNNDNNNHDHTVNSDMNDTSNINNLSIPSNSALDALIHMTTSTMQQLKHDGDFSDELNESTTIQFYNKVSQTRKRRKTRTTFSNCQLNELENNFNRQRYLTPTDRDRIAKHLGLTNTQVITWFQNRRAKLKREAEELERDVMALKKQKQQKFTCLSLTDHNHNEIEINNENEQGDNDDDNDDNDDNDEEEQEQEQKEENTHKIQYFTQSPSISSLKHFTSPTLNTHETLNMNLFINPFNQITNESFISDKLLNEKCLKRNKDLSEQQFHLLNHHINNYCNNNNNRKNNIDGINKGRSFKKCHKIWCPALELEQEIS